MDVNKIAELANIMKINGLTLLDWTEGENRLVLEAAPAKAAAPVPAPVAEPLAAPAPAEQPVVAAEAVPAAEDAAEPDFYEQKTPLVGTVYLAPQTGAAPFVSVGDHIGAGETICIVESMKMFNQIAADCSGVVEEICVSNGQIVEYGQTLFRIRED